MRRRYRRPSNLSTGTILIFAIASIVILPFIGLVKNTDSEAVSTIVFTSSLVMISIIALVGVTIWKIEQFKRAKRMALRLADIDQMSGVEFERYVGEILKAAGYSVSFTKTTGDFGADIIAKKHEVSYSVQLKRYKGYIGVEALYQASGGLEYYKCQKAVVITNSFFASSAKKLAASSQVYQIIDRGKLSEWILAFQKKNITPVMDLLE